MSPGLKEQVALVRSNSNAWVTAAGEGQDADRMTPVQQEKRNNALMGTEKSDKTFDLQTPENTKRNYQEWENWSYKKIKNEK